MPDILGVIPAIIEICSAALVSDHKWLAAALETAREIPSAVFRAICFYIHVVDAFYIYLGCLGVGLLFTLVSAVAGHAFGGHGDFGHDGDMGGGASKLTDDVTQIMTQPPPIIEGLSGVKLEKLLEQVPALKGRWPRTTRPPREVRTFSWGRCSVPQ